MIEHESPPPSLNQISHFNENYLPKFNSLFIVACLILSLFKLWLVSQNEIIARLAPHDQLWFAKAANFLIHLNWLGPFDNFTLIRQPGYPIWIWLVHQTGIPLRIASEFLLIFSGVAFTSALIKARAPIWLAIASLVFILFNPISFQIFNEVESETLYLPLLLFSLSGFIWMFILKNKYQLLGVSLITGGVLALLWNTREENILISFYLTIFALLVVISDYKKGHSIKEIIKKLSFVILIPSLLIFIFTFTIKTINYLNYKGFQTSDVSAPGFDSAIRSLTRIKVDDSSNFSEITQEARQKAYQASPTLRFIEKNLELTGKNWSQCGEVEKCNIPIAVLVFALRDAAFLSGLYQSASFVDGYYKTIAFQINSACKKGTLECQGDRNPHFPIPPSKLLSMLPGSLVQVSKRFIQTNTEDVFTPAPLWVEKIFNEIANRRPELSDFNSLKEHPPVQFFIQTKVGILYKYLAIFVSLLGLLGLLLTIYFYRLFDISQTINQIIIILFLVTLSRILLVAALEAALLPHAPIRYLFPVMPIYFCLCLILTYRGSNLALHHFETKPFLSSLRNIVEKPERIFFIYSSIFGVFFLFITPPIQSPDENAHFFRSFQISEGTFIGEKKDSFSGGILPGSLLNTANKFTQIPFHTEKKIKPGDIFESNKLSLNPQERIFIPFPNTVLYSPVPYLPQALGIGIGRLFNVPTLSLTYFGRFFNLLIWILLSFLAIQITPIFKWVFLFLALTPMSIFQSASLSADGFTNGISFLLIAKCLQCSIDEKKLSLGDLFQLFFLALGVSLSKQAYFPLLLLLFMISPQKIGSVKRYLSFIAICFLGNLFALGLWSQKAMKLYVPLRSDVVTSIPLQFKFILGHPLHYFSTLFHTLSQNYIALFQQFIGVLGWVDTALPKFLWITYGIFLIFVGITDKKENVLLGWKNRFIILASFSFSTFLVCTLLYLHFSPIGGPEINLQGRYFIPAAPLALLILYNNFIPEQIGSKFFKSAIPILIPLITLSWTLFTLKNRYYE